MPYQNINLIPIYIALGVGVALVVLALWKRVLTIPATVSAFFILLLSALFTSYSGLTIFAVSFVLSAVLGLIKKEKRKEREEGLYPHVGARGIVQVLSNGYRHCFTVPYTLERGSNHFWLPAWLPSRQASPTALQATSA